MFKKCFVLDNSFVYVESLAHLGTDQETR